MGWIILFCPLGILVGFDGMQCVGICGAKRSGKDTAAGIIQRHFVEYDINRFAAPVKRFSNDILFNGEDHDGNQKDTKTFRIPRCEFINNVNTHIYDLPVMHTHSIEEVDALKDMLVSMVTNKQYGAYFDITRRKAQQLIGTDWGRNIIGERVWVDMTPTHDNVIIADVRFANEACAVIDGGGVMIEVVGRGMGGDKHESETQDLSEFVKYQMHNTGDIAEFEIIIANFINMGGIETCSAKP